MSEDPREALLDVARDIVAKRGYVGLTMRTASAAVGVTPEVARRYYRNREALFAAAMRLPADPVSAIPTLMAPGIEGMGERLVRFTLDTLRDPEARNALMTLARTGVAAGHAVTGLQDFIEVGVVDRVATVIGVPDARMRSALITSYLLGVATMRYGVRLEPLASASDEEVIRMVAPVIQDLLDPRRPIPGSARARSEQPPGRSEEPVSPPSSAGPRQRTFDPDPAATRAKQAARMAAPAQDSKARERPASAAGRGTGGVPHPQRPASAAATGAAPTRSVRPAQPAPRAQGANRSGSAAAEGKSPAASVGGSKRLRKPARATAPTQAERRRNAKPASQPQPSGATEPDATIAPSATKRPAGGTSAAPSSKAPAPSASRQPAAQGPTPKDAVTKGAAPKKSALKEPAGKDAAPKKSAAKKSGPKKPAPNESLPTKSGAKPAAAEQSGTKRRRPGEPAAD